MPDHHGDDLQPTDGPSVEVHPTGLRGDLPALLDHWVAAGLITEQQADGIRTDQAWRAEPSGRAGASGRTVPSTPVLTEALGYLGGVLVLVGTVLLASRYWDDTPLVVRLGLVATATGLLLAAAPAVPARLGAVGDRARAVLWLLSVACFAGFLVLLGDQVVLDAERFGGADLALFTGAGTAAYAIVLWRRRRTGVQQAAVLGALSVTVAAGAAQVAAADTAPGLAVWMLSLVWLGLAWRGWLDPRRAAYLLGSIGALLGATIAAGENWGLVLAVVTAAALVGAAVVLGDLAVLGIGAVGTLVFLPTATYRFFPGALAAPLGLLVTGLLLLAAAQRTTRRRA